MAWPPTNNDRARAFAEDGAWFANHYACPCGQEWTDEWSCTCDDDCPACGVTCSPQASDELDGPDA